MWYTTPMKSTRAAGLVVTACSLAACRSATPEARAADGASPTPTVVVTAPPVVQPDCPVSEADASVAPSIPHELLMSAAWAKLREPWRKLDALTAIGSGPGAPAAAQVQGVGELAHQALDAIEKDPAAEALDPAVLPALRGVVHTRVQVLTGLEFRLMVSHRMPSESELATAHVGAAIEKRIDALIELRKAGASPQDYRVALEAVTGRIHLLIALQKLHVVYHAGLDTRAETLEELSRTLGVRRSLDTDASADAVIADLQRGIDEALRIAPVIDAMITDLER